VSTLVWILGFALLGSAGAVAAAASFLLFPTRVRQTLVPLLIGYATGTLLAVALVGLVPEAIERWAVEPVLTTVLAGLVLFFVLERLLIWRHCHVNGSCETHDAAGVLILSGDALHNFVDGIVIAAAFLASIPMGVATALAVILHELPQEVGDFAILLDSGFTRRRAFMWNMISGIATVPGALLAWVALDRVEHAIPPVLALSAASFLYIGLADLIPGLHRRPETATSVGQFLLILAGVGTVFLLHPAH
jgi:zinc and cadmium transporter